MAKKAVKSKNKKNKRKSKSMKTYPAPMHAVLAFAKMLEDQGQIDEFVKAAAEEKVTLTMNAKCVAFIKRYLTDSELHPEAARAVYPEAARGARAAARRVVDPCPCINR